MKPELLEMTTAIAAAYFSRNTIMPSEIDDVIGSIHSALERTGQEAEPEPEIIPAVSARASVKPGHVTCMECGRQMKMLKRHLMTEHGWTPDEYRARFSLPANHPLVAPDYAAVRRGLAKKIGLGHHPNAARGRKKAA